MPRPKTFTIENSLLGATATFRQHGYAGASMALLVKGMGINRASLYANFGDKESLYLRCLAAEAEVQLARLYAVAEAEESPIAKVKAILRSQLADMDADKAKDGCMIATAAAELLPSHLAVAQLVESYYVRLQFLISRCIDAAQRTGEVGPTLHIDNASRFLRGQIAGLRLMGKTQASITELDAMADWAYQSLLLAGQTK